MYGINLATTPESTTLLNVVISNHNNNYNHEYLK